MKPRVKSASSSSNGQTSIIKKIPIQHKPDTLKDIIYSMLHDNPKQKNKNYMAEQIADPTGRHHELTLWLQLSDM